MVNGQQQQVQQGGSTFGSKILNVLAGPKRLHDYIHERTAGYSPWLLLLPIALLWLDFFTGFNGICIKGALGTECQFASLELLDFILKFFASTTYWVAIAFMFAFKARRPNLQEWIYYSILYALVYAALLLGGFSIIILFHLAFAGFVYTYILKGFQREQEITQAHWTFLILFTLDMFLFPALYGLNTYSTNLPIFNIITSRLLLPIWFFYMISFTREGLGRSLITVVVMLFYIGYLGVYMYPYVQTQLAEIPAEQKSEFINAPIKAMKNYWLGIKEVIESRLDIATGGLYRSQVEKNQFEPLGVFFDRVRAAQPKFYTDEDVTLWGTIKSRTLSDPVNVNFTCFRWKDGKRVQAQTNEQDSGKRDIVYPGAFTVYTLEDKDVECTFKPKKLDAGTNIVTLSATYNFLTSAYKKNYFIDKERQRAMTRENLDPLKEFGITDRNPITVHTNGPVEIAIDLQPLTAVSDGRDVSPALGILLKNRDKITDKSGKAVGEWQGKIKKISELVVVLPKGITLEKESCKPVKFEIIDNAGDFCTASCSSVINKPCEERCITEQSAEGFQLCYEPCLKGSEISEATKKCNDECNSIFKGESEGEANYVGYSLNIEELEKRTRDEYKDIERFKTFLCRITPREGVLENTPITTKFIRVRARYNYLLEKSYNVVVEQAPSTIGSVFSDAVNQYAQSEGVDPDLVKAIAIIESGAKQCRDGSSTCPKDQVITNGVSLGIMQINVRDQPGRTWLTDASSICGAGKTAYDIDCNIQLGIKILKEKYEQFGRDNKPRSYTCGSFARIYQGWDAALRGYNGWGCTGADLNYVEKVKKAYSDIKQGLITSDIQNNINNLGSFILPGKTDQFPIKNVMAKQDNNGISLTWDASPSPNVKNYIVTRYREGNHEDDFVTDKNSFYDLAAGYGVEYYYLITAIDNTNEVNGYNIYGSGQTNTVKRSLIDIPT